MAGGGSWGTALCGLLAGQVAQVRWHCRAAEQALAINRDGRNPSHFPRHPLPDNIYATADLSEALDGCRFVYLALPSAVLREYIGSHSGAWEQWQDLHVADGQPGVLVNCSKGLMADPAERSDVWLAAHLPRACLAHLSGPNLAAEIMDGRPAAAVVAAPAGFEGCALDVQRQLGSDRFRVYTGTDLIGVEVAGFYKNIIAVAAGILDGLDFGLNARAVLITRGLAEMGRLVTHFGGRAETLQGLAGVGDLIATCGSPLSRNFQVGRRRAAGQGLAQIEAEMTEVAEGVNASRALHEWPDRDAQSLNWPELPIAEQVYRILHTEMDPQEAILELMRRPPKAE